MKKLSQAVSSSGGRHLPRMMAAALCLSALFGTAAHAQTWSVTNTTNNVGRPALNINYGSPQTGYPECAEFDLGSSFFRLSPDSSTAWASSILLNPAYWSNNAYTQGGTLTLQSHSVVNGNLVLNFTGVVGSLSTASTVTIHPPAMSATGTNAVDSIQADVSVAVTGSVVLDPQHPGEAFKVMAVSSMHDSDTVWDNQYIQSGAGSKFTYPDAPGWVIPNGVVTANNFQLQGGISTWQTQSSGGRAAPTISVTLDKARPILAHLQAASSPNNDNVEAWAASDNDGETVQSNWKYSVKAQRNYTVAK
jgi:hypothetical protein